MAQPKKQLLQEAPAQLQSDKQKFAVLAAQQLHYNGGSILTKQQKQQLAQLRQEGQQRQQAVLQTQPDEVTKSCKI